MRESPATTEPSTSTSRAAGARERKAQGLRGHREDERARDAASACRRAQLRRIAGSQLDERFVEALLEDLAAQ